MRFVVGLAVAVSLVASPVFAQAIRKPLVLNNGQMQQARPTDTIVTSTQIVGTGATTDGAITTATSDIQVLRTARGSPISTGVGGANEFPLFSSVFVPTGHGGGINYEVASMYGRCVTQDGNEGGLDSYDCVGIEGQGHATGTSQLHRIWGNNNVVEFHAGADGQGMGYETDIINRGSVGGLQTPKQKLGYFAVCKYANDCTAAYVIGPGIDAKWRYGFVGVRQYLNGECFSCLLDGNLPALPVFAGQFVDGHSLAQQSAIITGEPGTTRYQTFASGPNSNALVKRWEAGANSEAETFGTNAGSNYQICSYADSGAFITCPLVIDRASGVVFGGTLSLSNTASAARVRLTPTTYASLPACVTQTEGTQAYITDASAAITVWNQPVTAGGGPNKTFVKCDGTGWKAY